MENTAVVTLIGYDNTARTCRFIAGDTTSIFYYLLTMLDYDEAEHIAKWCFNARRGWTYGSLNGAASIEII